MPELKFILSVDASQFQSGAQKIVADVHRISDQISAEGRRIDSEFSNMSQNITSMIGKGVAAFGSLAALKAFGSEVIKVRGDIQALETSFEVLLGSKERADALFSEMRSFASSTPMQLDDLATAAQTMLGFNIAAEDVMPMLRSIGDIAMGDATKFQSLALAFSQMSATGKLMGQDLLQMINAGFNPLTEISAKTGKSVGVLKEEMSKGAISADMVADAFKSASAEGGKFGGMLDKQSKTINGAISNMKSAWQDALNAIGEEGDDVFADIINLGTEAIKNFETLGGVILTAAAAWGTYKAALMATEAYKRLMAESEAVLEAQRQAEIAALLERNGVSAAATAGEAEEAAAKQATATAIDEKVAALMRELEAELQIAEIEEQNAIKRLSLADDILAEEQSTLDMAQARYDSAVQLGDAESIATAEKELGAAASNRSAAEELKNAAAKEVAAAAAKKEGIQQRITTVQTEADSIAKQKNTLVTTLWGAATRAVTTAMHALKAAIASNPLGLLLTAVTTIIGLLMTFKKETDEATKASEKFGEAIENAMSDYRVNMAVLKNLDPASQTFKKAFNDLKKTYKQYGIIADEEKATVEELIKSHEALEKAIKQEAITREWANQIAAVNDDFAEGVKKVWDNVVEDVNEEARGAARMLLKGVFNQEELIKVRKEIDDANQQVWRAQSDYNRTADEKDYERVQYYTQKREQLYEGYVNRVVSLLSQVGVSTDEARKTGEKMFGKPENADGFINTLENLQRALKLSTDDINSAGNAMEEMAGSMSSAEMAARFAKMSEDDLNDAISQVVANVEANKDMEQWLTVHYDDSELPEYLKAEVASGTLAAWVTKRNEMSKKNPNARSFTVHDSSGRAYTESAEEFKRNTAIMTQRLKAKQKPKPKVTAPSKPTRAKTTRKSTNTGDSEAVKAEKKQWDEMGKQLDKEREKEERELEILENNIAMMEEGRMRRMAEIELERKRAELELKYDQKEWLRDIEDEARDQYYEKNKQVAYKRPQDGYQLEQDQKDYIDAQQKFIEWTEQHSLAEIYKDEMSALWDYMQEYGSFQERRAAITASYTRQIAEAATTGEALALQRQMDEGLKDLDFEELKKNMHWDVLFEGLDQRSEESLKNIRDQLKDILAGQDLKQEDYNAVEEKLGEVQDALARKTNVWKNALGLVIPELEEQRQLIQKAADAQERLNNATERQTTALNGVKKAREAISTTLAGMGFNTKADGSYTADDLNEYVKQLFSHGSLTNEQKQMRYAELVRLFGDLSKAEGKLTDTTEALGNAQEGAAQATEAAGNNIVTTIAVIDKVIHKVDESVQSANELFEQLGLADTAFGKGFASFAESSQYATKAWESLKSGNVFGVVSGVVGSLGSLGNALGAWGIGGMGASDRTLERDMEALTASNEALQHAIEKLTDDLTEGAVADAAETYKAIQDSIRQSQRNTQEQLRRSGAAYNNGFLGIGGKGSSNARINAALSAGEWARVTRITGVAVNNAAQFWSLTSEQMANVAKYAPDVYARIKQYADEGFADAGQYMDDYIGYWEQLRDATDAYNEKLTSTSFDSVVESFASSLMDMSKDAASFSEDFETYMRTAIINALVSEKYKPLLQSWYEGFASAMVDGMLTEAESARLKREWDEITKQGLQDRDTFARLFGWGDTTGEDGGAYGASKSFSQEQGDELNGRLTAIQIRQEQIRRDVAAGVEALRSVSAWGDRFDEQRAILLSSNSHLEDIARYTKNLIEMGNQLNRIATNTARL